MVGLAHLRHLAAPDLLRRVVPAGLPLPRLELVGAALVWVPPLETVVGAVALEDT